MNDMSKFVGEEGAAGAGVRGVLASVEGNMRAYGVRVGVDRARGSGGCRIGVDADVAEIMAEAGLEEGASGGVERMARRTKDVTDDAWDMSRCSR